jgi:hypothetical protein
MRLSTRTLFPLASDAAVVENGAGEDDCACCAAAGIRGRSGIWKARASAVRIELCCIMPFPN